MHVAPLHVSVRADAEQCNVGADSLRLVTARAALTDACATWCARAACDSRGSNQARLVLHDGRALHMHVARVRVSEHRVLSSMRSTGSLRPVTSRAAVRLLRPAVGLGVLRDDAERVYMKLWRAILRVRAYACFSETTRPRTSMKTCLAIQPLRVSLEGSVGVPPAAANPAQRGVRARASVDVDGSREAVLQYGPAVQTTARDLATELRPKRAPHPVGFWFC